jgi:hypothetical protein
MHVCCPNVKGWPTSNSAAPPMLFTAALTIGHIWDVTHLRCKQLLHVLFVKHSASDIIEHLAGLVWRDVLGLQVSNKGQGRYLPVAEGKRNAQIVFHPMFILH